MNVAKEIREACIIYNLDKREIFFKNSPAKRYLVTWALKFSIPDGQIITMFNVSQSYINTVGYDIANEKKMMLEMMREERLEIMRK